jgi:hypothetical protein
MSDDYLIVADRLSRQCSEKNVVFATAAAQIGLTT